MSNCELTGHKMNGDYCVSCGMTRDEMQEEEHYELMERVESLEADIECLKELLKIVLPNGDV